MSNKERAKITPEDWAVKIKADEDARAELSSMGVDPQSLAGKEFLFRLGAFGIMGANPPRPELGVSVPREE